ncbi:hypothetical protein [Burkholderia ubonensis]|uniref:hypothetical protein n=1 Tax=Burkholderia ubonensis TaxID=101571 RepID=UPI0009B49FDD|nr:hypothetical protein [Burkholderia ubonensis]
MLLDSVKIDVDFNGIVIFSYPDLMKFFADPVVNGQNILSDFTQTDLGDKVVDGGVVLPIINIDDGGYLVRFFEGDPESSVRRRVVFSDSGYVLKIDGDLYIADAAVFWDWEEYLGWTKVAIPRGYYSVKIEGVQHISDDGSVGSIGYDVIVNRVEDLPKRTAQIRQDSRVS